MRTLIIGEVLVDLVCHEPVTSLDQARSFTPHFGGAAANVAVQCRRQGAEVALAGGVGADDWGDWLAARLEAEGVDLTWFARTPDVPTPVAFALVDPQAVPRFQIYGDGIEAGLMAVGERLVEAVEETDALFVTSNTLVGEQERALTLAARDRALELGHPVVFDPNLRLHRWPTASRAVEESLDVVRRAFLVKCNHDEALTLTGERDVEAAAASLLAAGARHVVVTLGRDGALLRGGPIDRDQPGVPATPVNTTGAGDAFTGVLLAKLALSRYYPATLAAALPEAVATAARVTEAWGATP